MANNADYSPIDSYSYTPRSIKGVWVYRLQGIRPKRTSSAVLEVPPDPWKTHVEPDGSRWPFLQGYSRVGIIYFDGDQSVVMSELANETTFDWGWGRGTGHYEVRSTGRGYFTVSITFGRGGPPHFYGVDFMIVGKDEMFLSAGESGGGVAKKRRPQPLWWLLRPFQRFVSITPTVDMGDVGVYVPEDD
jgi:hypothetical protein